MNSKKEEFFFKVLMIISLMIISGTLLYIIGLIFYKGMPLMTLEMLTSEPSGGFYFGKEGGILNAIVGTIYLAVGSVILALIIGLPVALFINVYISKYRRITESIRFILDLLWGIPSIVYGAFGFLFMASYGLRASLLAGIFIVAAFILPIIIRSMDEVFKLVPKGLLEASFSLGANKRKTAFSVYVKQSFPGLITAVLLSFGRAAGDAAAVLFTVGFTDSVPTSLTSPAATLPLSVFFQLSSPIPEVKERAYASALVLTFIVLIISLSARWFSKKYINRQIKF